MQDLQSRIEALLAAPAGRAFLLIAAESRLAPETIANPGVSLQFATLALDTMSRWRNDRTDVLAELARADAGMLENMARAVLACPGAAWWFAPLDESQQVWLSNDHREPRAEMFSAPDRPPTSWERYAQKPAGGLFTSTLIGGSSSARVTIALGTSDFAGAFHAAPIACWRLGVAPGVRVFEVDGPETWHDLCARYSAESVDGRVVPDWSLVARDFDAVHLTLSGLLTAEQVRFASAAGWSQHEGWDFEQTLWLRWCFTSVEPLPDMHPVLEPSVDLHRGIMHPPFERGSPRS